MSGDKLDMYVCAPHSDTNVVAFGQLYNNRSVYVICGAAVQNVSGGIKNPELETDNLDAETAEC